ncbi:hypothetical protein FACS189435_2090 [Bacteroidia bacterium]|nr:hypothetical protein FACS189435_2090 [Bacteroidia bacterium]
MHKLLFIFTTIFLSAALWGQKGDWCNEPGEYALPGSGTESDPYLISSVPMLIYLADQVNTWQGNSFEGKHFLLTHSLDLGQHYWIPIGSEREQPFRGIFNGNGKTIHNLYIGSAGAGNVFEASGLFGYLGNGAKITNLAIEGGRVVGGGREPVSRAGSLAGLLSCRAAKGRQDSIIIRNCHNRGVDVEGGPAEVSVAGGLVGESYSFCEGGGEAVVLLEGCTNSGAVSGSEAKLVYTGGIMGKGRGHGYCTGQAASTGVCLIYSCRNRGAVTGGTAAGGAEANASTGGILGYGYASGDGYGNKEGTGIFSLKYCLNNGVIRGGEASTAQAETYTGGLLGYGGSFGYGNRLGAGNRGKGYGKGSFILSCSANRGRVEGGGAAENLATASTGGLLGFASASAAFSGKGREEGVNSGDFSVNNCYSYATLSASSGMVGGLAGSLATISSGSRQQVSLLLQDCYAAGVINRADVVYPVVTGGIVGLIQKSEKALEAPQVSDCLAVLSHLDGTPGQTHRIAGEVQGVQPPYNKVLGRNYAYAGSGDWGGLPEALDGFAWDFSMLAPPVSRWDFKNKVWLLEEDHTSMPMLNGLPNQSRIAVP